MDVKWIKITTDMFDNRKIRHLRRLPDGNNIVLIWVMLLTMAGRCNAGGMIFLMENIPYTPKMLADELDFEENTITLAINALEKFGMVSTDPLMITNWEEYQNTEKMERIREQGRIRKQRQRALQSASRPCHADVTRDVTHNVTQCHAPEEDIEEDKDIEIYISEEGAIGNSERGKPPAEDPPAPSSDFLPVAKKILEAWNRTGLMKARRFSLNSERGRRMQTLVRDFGIETVLEGIERAGKSEFLRSGTWKVTLDWILNPDNFQKTLEGQYDERWEKQNDDLGGAEGSGGPKAGGGRNGIGDTEADIRARRQEEARRRYPNLKTGLD